MPKRQFPQNSAAARQVILILTESCNLQCTYCYEKNKNARRWTLSADVIQARIREEMLADDGYGSVMFVFFGGEPLLEFGTIVEVVEWFERTSWPAPAKAVQFTVDSNGTLLDEDKKRWFTAHRDLVTVGLSLDGTKETHDRNRCNSYDAVARHIDFYRQNWPDYPVKMTIGAETIDQTYAGVAHLLGLGLNVEFDVVFEDVWGDVESERRAVRSWAEQLDALVTLYAARPALPRPKVLHRELNALFDGAGLDHRSTFCGAGKAVTCLASDGREYPCYKFTPLVVDTPLFDVFAAPDGENPQCARCPFVRICSTCEGHNYLVTGSCFNRTTFHCRFFQVSLLATAKLSRLEHPEDLSPVTPSESKEERVARLRRLLVIRTVNDLCAPVLDWAYHNSTA